MKLHTVKFLSGTAILQLILLASALAISPASYSAIALDRTRVIFNGEQNSVALNVSNQNKQLPYLAQGWLEDESGKKIKSPFAVLPPVQRIEPGKESQIKVQALPAVKQLPQDRESVFYFNLREIPPKSNKANTLQLALQTKIKLFYRPASLVVERNATPYQEQLTLTRRGNEYVVNNPTSYFITLVDLAESKTSQGLKTFSPVMVSPKSTLLLTSEASKAGNNPVLTYVNDYGGRPQLVFQCASEHCKVVAERK